MADDKSEEPAELEGDGTQAEQAEPEAVANGDPEAAEAGDGSDEPAAEPDAPESLEDAFRRPSGFLCRKPLEHLQETLGSLCLDISLKNNNICIKKLANRQ